MTFGRAALKEKVQRLSEKLESHKAEETRLLATRKVPACTSFRTHYDVLVHFVNLSLSFSPLRIFEQKKLSDYVGACTITNNCMLQKMLDKVTARKKTLEKSGETLSADERSRIGEASERHALFSFLFLAARRLVSRNDDYTKLYRQANYRTN